ncbi:LysR family transcriptional regulator [Mesorhizobium sp. UC22_110]|jgi:LysR family glycine cleavage system transcriptional activator|uniref:LysR family transcriptional regulator n=2 Tax=unclassified Mesorhizobium TaxID=325217 RepID=UPI0037570EDE
MKGTRSKLPPLNAIRAFDAIARQESMSKAALELGISPPSVTHHLQTLEEFLGTKLIARTTNSIALTPQGRMYSDAIRPGFDILINATDSLMRHEVAGPLRITCVPTLAISWLAEQLAALELRLPGLHIQCDFSPVPLSFDRNTIDFAIRYGSGDYADADSELLFIDKIAPVCTPETARLIGNVDDYLKITRLPTPESTPEGRSMWYYWAKSFYSEEYAQKFEVSFGHAVKGSRFTVEVLKVSQCVAIMDYVTVGEEVRRGNLVSPFDQWVNAPYAYYLLTPKRRSQREATKQLKALLKRTVNQITRP